MSDASPPVPPKIPRASGAEDYTRELADQRRAFVAEQTGTRLDHLGHYSQEEAMLAGNVEHFMGVAQVPIGLAGPLLVDGEHAQGEFWVPMATIEGTLVASYNRGMKVLREAGGVRTTILDDRMQRAPSFVFPSARESRDFGLWLTEHVEEIAAAAEETTTTGKLIEIEQYSVGRVRYTRFDYTTGDAAGQNMTGKATLAACHWILDHYDGIEQFYLESNVATDKKASYMNMLHTRGKRVVAEAVIPDELVRSRLNTTSEQLFRSRLVSQQGALLSGANNNGSHSANGITALFIATGQDAANVAESSAAYASADLTPEGDYRYSITLPSLICATYGGGTGLGTQRECLEMLGCYGRGGVGKLAEIIAATVLCGEISLGAAVVAGDWVEAHDKFGRNR